MEICHLAANAEERSEMNLVLHLGLVIMLGVCAVMDCIYRKVWMPLVGIMLGYSVIGNLLAENIPWQGLLAGMGVGVFFYMAAVLTRGQIGKADGILLGILVMVWKPWNGMLLVIYSFLYSFVAAVFLVVLWRKGRNTRMPMVAFMWLGYITVLCL